MVMTIHDSTSGQDLLDQCVSLWRDTLRRDDIGPDSHFFAEGGQSLLAARLVHQISGIVGFRVGLKSLFVAPTPRKLAEFLAGHDTDS